MTTTPTPEPRAGMRADGSPDPAYAVGLGLVPAPLGRRVLAFAIDAALVAVLLVPAVIGGIPLAQHVVAGGALEIGPDLVVPLVLLGVSQLLVTIALIIQLLVSGLRGVTLGKRITGLRAVNVVTLEKPGFLRVALRAIVLSLSAVVVPVLGAAVLLASPLWEDEGRGRGWLDRLAGSWLIDARLGLNPADAKAMRLARKRMDAPPAAPVEAIPSLATGAEGDLRFHPATRSRAAVVGAPETAPTAVVPAPVAAPSPSAPLPISLPPAPVAVPGGGRAELLADDGARYPLAAVTVIGRNPAAPAGDQAQPVSVSDPASSMSKTHARFAIGDDGVWVEDLHSSNGTRVLDPSGILVEAAPGRRVHAPWGGSVELGDRRFTVLAP